MSGKEPAEGKGIPLGTKCKGGTTHAGEADCTQREAGGTLPQFLPQNGNLPIPAIFESGLREKLEPLFDATSAALAYNDVYLKVKEQPFWPDLLTQTCLAFYRVNHRVIPKTEAQLREAQAELYVGVTKRSGRDYYPNFNERNRHLRSIDMEVWAKKAREAAKTFAKRNGELSLGSHFLKEILATLWLPASLWMLSDKGVANALPFLLNKEGKTFLSDWSGIESMEGQDVSRLCRDFGLPRAAEMFGVPCADVYQDGRLNVVWSVLSRG